MGLLTKIFGNPEGSASGPGEAPASEPGSGAAPESQPPPLPAYDKAESGTSGIRPAVDGPASRPREPRAPATNRRPEHPRMYLRPTPMVLDPAVPGSTRRQGSPGRPTTKETPSARASRRVPGPYERTLEPPPRRAPPSEPPSSSRPPPSRPSMVVSPVSLTAEELQPGARPKQPTLVGLGMAGATPPLPEVAAKSDVRARARSGSKDHPSDTHAREEPGSAPAASVAPAPFEDSARSDAAVPDELVASAHFLADFAIKLWLGPLSRSWAPEVQRCARVLLAVGKQRREAALSGVSARLVDLMSPESLDGNASDDAWGALDGDTAASGAGSAKENSSANTLSGEVRDQVMHEVTRLAGLLPEWPAFAQDLAEEARRREGRVVRELLTSVDGLRRDLRARLEEQMRLEQLEALSVEALADELEIPEERAVELRRVLAVYRQDRETRRPDLNNTLGIHMALSELEQRSNDFDDCDPEDKRAQREFREKRRLAMSRVALLLAERGELEWLELLEGLSIGERTERLRQWLDAAAERPS